MPFKYGIATMTGMPMVFLRLAVQVDRTESVGVSADLLPPKWFTKIPAKPIEEEITEMVGVIRQALAFATGMNAESPFKLWRMLYSAQSRWAESNKVPPLLAHFGTSLVERAMIEAICRVIGRPFHRALQRNDFGIRLDDLHLELGECKPADLLPAQPLGEITARHTVGLSDPLTDEDISPEEKVNDGLPQSLGACIRAYGLRHFKIKVNGDLQRDVERLHRIAEIIQRERGSNFAFTLDGNEQFRTLAAFRAFWEEITRSERLKDFLSRLIFVEQPVHRDEALKPEVGEALRDWPGHPPLIIDESDGALESLPTALSLGYAGTSHKNCKGIFKGVANRCLLLKRAAGGTPAARYLMSGEDLCNVGPVALLQDLAVCAALGIQSVERNGHHYNAGLSQFPKPVQDQVLKSHADLYHASSAGWPTLTINGGLVQLASVNQSPFGVRFVLDVEQFASVGEQAN